MVLLIKKEGIFTSLQDLGRFGLQRFGITPRGAMDRTAARIVDLLAGNDEAQPVLEFHFPGPEIVFETGCTFVLGGADFAAELDGGLVLNWHCHTAPESAVLCFRRKISGNRCYIAINGGLRLASDDSTNIFVTERLRSGQRLVRNSDVQQPLSAHDRGVSRSLLPAYSTFPTIRIVPGAEFPDLLEEDKRLIEEADFAISHDSNRMGFRLHGPALSLVTPKELVSAAVTFGTIQLLPDGQLVVLMADHQTSGGYPRVGHVISADLPLAAQLGPGDRIAFKIVDIAAAERAAGRIESDLKKLKMGLNFGRYW